MSRHVCPSCEYVYDEAVGDPREGWPAGTPIAVIDADWCCPDCGVREAQDFVPESEWFDGAQARAQAKELQS